MTTPENPGNELVPYGDNLPEMRHEALEPQWECPTDALQVTITGAYLGRLTGVSGFPAGYKDRHEEEIADGGFTFIVSQSSAGGTYLEAKAMEGHMVEALNPDASSRSSMWVKPHDDSGEVDVDADWGKLGTLKESDYRADFNFGNPGTRSGIIRVTGPHGERHHYLLVANFQGQPDDWRITGAVHEVWPNKPLELKLAPRQLTGTVIDPSVIGGEIERTTPVTHSEISALRTAYEHDTPGVRILYAGRREADAARSYADLTLGLLTEIARQRPDILEGTEVQIDELGRRTRLITNDPRTGFLDRLEDDDENRVRYLEAIAGSLRGRQATSDNAHNFTLFATQAFDILEQSFAHGATFNMDSDSTVLRRMQELIVTDLQTTAAAVNRRAETLKNTIFDPNWERHGISYGVAIPGQKVELTLSGTTPLLTAEQTHEAFFEVGKTDSYNADYSRRFAPTLALLEIGGERYALVESSVTTRYYSNYRSEAKLGLLRILSQPEDPRYGHEVREHALGFGIESHEDIQVLYDPRQAGKKGYASEIDAKITIGLDEETQKVTIISPYMKVGVLANSDSLQTKSWEAGDRATVEERRKVKRWQKEVKSIERDTAALRDNLQQRFENWVAATNPDEEAKAQFSAEIEETVTRGPMRFWTYNGRMGDTWHRSQAYHVTVDTDGNIWGDFEPVRYETGITGRPLTPGRHLVRRNPTLKRES